MDVFFKLKHYLKPYFLLKPSYAFNDKAKGFNLNYWISGYFQNIIHNKWEIENGIPLGLYTKDLDLELKKRVHISGLCEYCFACVELNKQENVYPVLDFLEKSLQKKYDKKNKINYSFWKTYINPFKGEYFVHGMGQGQLLSLFSRYWKATNNEKYFTILKLISNSYLIDFDTPNGFVNLEGGTYFEEYPKFQETDAKVLNGWMLSVIGLSDYLAVSSPEIDDLYDKKKALYICSLKTLVLNLKNYNLGFWSTYCQPKTVLNVCSIHYQIQHISFLETLYHITGEGEFMFFHKKLLKQFNNPFYRFYSLFIKLFISNIFKYGRFYKIK